MESSAISQTTESLSGTLAGFFSSTLGLDPVALAFAILAPLLLLYARHEVRLRRLRAIRDFLISYGSLDENRSTLRTSDKDGPTRVTTPCSGTLSAAAVTVKSKTGRKTGISNNPSFEFVKSKYISDIKIKEPPASVKFDELTEVDQIDLILDSIGPFGTARDLRIFASTLGVMLLSYFGFVALGHTLACGLDSAAVGCAPSSPVEQVYGSHEHLLVIGSLAFAGAYIAALRYFVRAVAVFDLTPYSFLRQSVEIIASVLFTIVLFVVFRNPTQYAADVIGAVASAIANPAGGTPATEPDPNSIPAIWYGLAPLLGLLPQSATKFLLMKFQDVVTWTKTSDDRFVGVTRILSPDIIDGIDYDTRFRLEECGIFDIQNLATYNPIMLHIESPYGIYEVIDWIAQAQLCHIVGVEKFLIFREFNIRTIFDLERAISGKTSPDAFDEICLSVLVAPTKALKDTLKISEIELVAQDGSDTKSLGANDFVQWTHRRLQGASQSRAAEQMMRWIADDLHVRRLRRLWADISDSLGSKSQYMPDNIDATENDGGSQK